jgi:hypothetical protein
MASQTVSRVGWIGFGKMEVPICGRLREYSYQVKAHCRSAKCARVCGCSGSCHRVDNFRRRQGRRHRRVRNFRRQCSHGRCLRPSGANGEFEARSNLCGYQYRFARRFSERRSGPGGNRRAVPTIPGIRFHRVGYERNADCDRFWPDRYFLGVKTILRCLHA